MGLLNMADGAGDPRVYFAAERTLLAWIRTGIAVMAFGFVVARFGLFLRLLQAQGGEAPAHGLSSYVGAGLVALGIVATGAGALEYRRFCRRLRPEDLPTPRASYLPLALAWMLVALGSILAVTLLA
jgi:putative membrane protein